MYHIQHIDTGMLLQIERIVIKFMPKATKLVLVLQDKFFFHCKNTAEQTYSFV